MGENWLITGGCGFIGINLVKHLLDETDHFIRIIDNLQEGRREDLSRICKFNEINSVDITAPDFFPGRHRSQIELIVGDILDSELALKIGAGIDITVHLAANTGVAPSVEDPRVDCMTNVIGTFNYLESARFNKIKRFIFASSGAPIGECEPPINEELAPHPVSPYGASKLAGEGYCSAYYRTFGVETIALRFGNVYGPGSGHKNSVVAKFIKQALNGELLEIYGDGKQTRDFIYVDDLIRAIRLVSAKPGIGGETFQIATYKETTVAEIAHAIKEIIEKETDSKVEIVQTAKRLGDVRRNYSDISKAKSMIGYEPQIDLSIGLKNTFEYFKTGNF
jgi:UDP-glucose 4-epimerase